MITISSYKKILNPNPLTVGQARQAQANMIMEKTWNRDLQSKICYIYDYYHDSEPDKNYNLHPDKDNKKTPIEAKYIVTTYGSLSKDQVEYHLQFRPSQDCPLEYYSEALEQRYGAEFPIGLYIDIPDEKGIYRKWLICSRDYDLQFISYSILPCNYYFHWIRDNKKYKMWGVARLRNSYNSGLWTDYKFTTIENQDQLWLPSNDISDDLYYTDDFKNQRIIVSARIKKPLVWQVSKVENLHPLGINKFTVAQTEFNQFTDYIVPIEEADSVYEMYADYRAEGLEPQDIKEENVFYIHSEIKCVGNSNKIKLGGNYKTLSIHFYDSNNSIVDNISVMNDNWSFRLNGTDIKDSGNLLEVKKISDEDFSKIKVRLFNKQNAPDPITAKQIDYTTYIGQKLSIICSDDEGRYVSSIDFIVTN